MSNNSNSNNRDKDGSCVSFSSSTLRGALIITMFTVVIIQLHLALNKFYSQSAPCPLEVGHENHPMLDGFKGERRAKSNTALEPTGGVYAPNSMTLPEINEQGMIIFYLHIPKTGGTTMMDPFQRNKHWRYRMVYGWNKQDKYRQEMYTTLENWEPGMKIFYEYHAGLSSPYMDLIVREDLLKWRAMAKVRNIPFFAFTVLREPLSFAVSHFNYYNADRKKGDTRYHFVENPTEDDFVQLTLPNPQCLFCVHTEAAYYQSYREAGKPIHVPKEGCEAVYDSFVTELDWVGTTEALSTETFPLIERVGNVKYPPHSKNKSRDKIVKKNLKPETVDYVRNITQFDQDMYNRAQLDFPISMWKNWDHEQHKGPVELPDHIPHLHMRTFDAPDLLGEQQRKKEKEERKKAKAEGRKWVPPKTVPPRLPSDHGKTWNTALA